MKETARWGAVIVNYNSARFALDAAMSVLGERPDAHVVIVDNASTNDSMNVFQTVIRDRRRKEHLPANPVVDQEIRYALLSDIHAVIAEDTRGEVTKAQLTILRAKENKGFAAGCNIGLRFLERMDCCTHYLLLNPDAVIGKGAMSAFEDRLADEHAGLCGATILLAGQPGRVQAFGGAALNPLTLMGRNIGQGDLLFSAPAASKVEANIDYPLGASIALRRSFLHDVGYMDERYFLYYEEADWAMAGKAVGQTVWAREAYVFHHYGVASKSVFPTENNPSQRSPLSEYHMIRSRLLFCLKWRPWLAPIVLATGLGQCLMRLRRGRIKAAVALARGLLPGAPPRYLYVK